MVSTIDSPLKTLKKIITGQTRKERIDFYLVTEVSPAREDGAVGQNFYTVNIAHPVVQSKNFENVEVLGQGLGNFKGMMLLPQVNDLVLVAFVDDNTPVVIGSLFNRGTGFVDNIPQIGTDEMLIAPLTSGSFQLFRNSGDVEIRTFDTSGNAGAKMKLNSAGSFKVLNGVNSGFQCDLQGNIVISGNTVNFTQSKLNF